MRIAVTGSTGFIGRNLVYSLKEKGHEVLEISRSAGLNICDWESVKNVHSCQAIVHLAAKTFVPDSFNNPREFYEVNNMATINALELARLWKANFIYMSSYFYGPPKYIPVDEEHPLNPHNPYAESKFISEELCRGYNRDFGVSVTAFRLFNLYGPGQKGSLIIPEILKQIKSGKVVLKDPRPKRDYIHIDQVISIIIKTLSLELDGFNILNLGTGKSYSVKNLVETFKKVSPFEFDIKYTNEYRKGEVLESVADITKLNETVGLSDEIGLEEGLKTLFV